MCIRDSCDDCAFVLISYRYTHVSSPVIMFFMKFLSALAWSSSSWLMLTRFSFWSLDNRHGTNFAEVWCMFSFPVTVSWHEPTLIPNSSAISTTAKPRSSLIIVQISFYCHLLMFTKSWIFISWCSSCFETSKPVLALRSAQSSPRACWSISNISV